MDGRGLLFGILFTVAGSRNRWGDLLDGVFRPTCFVSLYRKQGGYWSYQRCRIAYGKDGFLLRRCDLMRDMGFCISMKRSLLEVLGCLGRDIVGKCSLGASLLL